MLMRILHAVRAAIPAPLPLPEDIVERRFTDELDHLAPLDEAMMKRLAEIDPREATDPDIHVVICGMRYEFLGSALHALYNAVRSQGKQSRFNSGQLLIVRSEIAQLQGVLRLVAIALFVLSIIELFGRDKGLELITRVAERWLGV